MMEWLMLLFVFNGGAFEVESVKMEDYDTCEFSANIVNNKMDVYVKAVCIKTGKVE